MNLRRIVAGLTDTAPVLILAAIAGAGSFTHIRDTAAQHGQGGPMSWAVAICIDLTCVMAARERQRDKQHGGTRSISWPTIVLAGGILLSLAANLAQAQPTAWGRITAATPSGAFLVAVSMLERRAGRKAAAMPTGTQPAPKPIVGDAPPLADPAPIPVAPVKSPPPVPAATSQPAAPLVDFARRVADEHEQAHGEPITPGKLRARLGVSDQLAADLLDSIRTALQEQPP